MPETGSAPAQGADGGEAQGATGAAPNGAPAGNAQGASGGEPESASLEALTRKITELERDNRRYRQQERDREAAERQKSDADKTEAEKLTDQVAKLQEQLAERVKREQEQSLRAATATAATRLGFQNLETALTLVRGVGEQVEWDEKSGEPRNVEAILTAFAKNDPGLVKPVGDFGGGTRGTSPGASAGAQDMNAMIRSAVKR